MSRARPGAELQLHGKSKVQISIAVLTCARDGNEHEYADFLLTKTNIKGASRVFFGGDETLYIANSHSDGMYAKSRSGRRRSMWRRPSARPSSDSSSSPRSRWG